MVSFNPFDAKKRLILLIFLCLLLILLTETPKSLRGNGVEFNLFREVTLITSSTKSISPLTSGRQLGTCTVKLLFLFSTVNPNFDKISICFSIFIFIPVIFSTLAWSILNFLGICGFLPEITKFDGSPPNKSNANFV